MAKRKKFDVVAAVKSNARDVVGQPKPSSAILSKKDKPERFKKDLFKEEE
jgi:hypothetical protein